ncbi:MAG: hypothetical protein WCW77_01380 [Patescibacteria group bacterium]
MGIKSNQPTIWSWQKLWDEKWNLLKEVGGAAFKAALGSFLNEFAYESATYLATGDTGQGSMFFQSSWEDFIADAGDAAAGAFLEKMISGIGNTTGWWKGFNVCDPNISVKIKIALGLYNKTWSKPKCSFSTMAKNWKEKLSSETFLSDFQNMFNPYENDLGIALIMNAGSTEYITGYVKSKEKTRDEANGMKAVTEKISKWIKTPAETVRTMQAAAWEKSTFGQTVFTGTAADAIDIFINTLLGKLMQQWLKSGLVSDYTADIEVTEPDADFTSSEGIEAAEARFRSLTEPSFGVRGDYNILSELTVCANPSKAGPTNCVITDKFRQAITKRLTVAEAIKDGYLKSSGKFGFLTGGSAEAEPKYKDEDYPYRSMVILRKFRIIPVGWELAAQYISKNSGVGSCTLGDMVYCFDEVSAVDYKSLKSGSCKMDSKWCRGMVDPGWVLKAPLNYCRKEGAGPEIESSQTSGDGDDSKVEISRNDNYCADEQTCVDEDTDGSCNSYGYCTEERRTWNFNTKSCKPLNNTCQSFKSDSGSSVSYLQNTLDFSSCTEANAGCRGYCTGLSGISSTASWQCGIGKEVYLNKNAAKCTQSNEGCHEFIRATEVAGVNLLPNPSFEEDLSVGGWSGFGTASTDGAADKNKSLKLNSSGLLKPVAIGLSDYSLADRTLSFSLSAKNCGTEGKFGFYDYNSLELLTSNLISDNSGWQRLTLTYTFPEDYGFASEANSLEIGVKDFSGSDCLIDAVKLEFGASATEYSDYQASGKVYEKFMPDYYASECYENSSGATPDYSLKSGAPSACSNFARRCNEDEVDCNMYTSVKDGGSIPASVRKTDQCPAECVGYDTYIQKEAKFDSKRDEYFIPKSAKICAATAVGCDQFTNLDEAEKKGEARQNYTYLRQCIKPELVCSSDLATPCKNEVCPTGGTCQVPASAKANCSEFYTWEGSSESGFQLKVFNLQVDSNESGKDNGAPDESPVVYTSDQIVPVYNNDPAVTYDDRGDCNQYTYGLPITDGRYNSNCRQFYNRAGEISYHLYTSTISCSDNCHPYRRSENNNLYSEEDCEDQCGSASNYCACATACSDSAAEGKSSCLLEEGQYVYCKNGGRWNVSQASCLYAAIPGEGISCQDSQVGCREYSGNQGSNMRTILANSFDEDQDFTGWDGLSGSSIEPSATALKVGGKSLLVKAGTDGAKAGTSVESLLHSGYSYTLTFLAKTSAAEINVYFLDGYGTTTPMTGDIMTAEGGDWKIYRYNIDNFSKVQGDESIIFSAASDFYIDDVKLVEIVDRYYLIKNSWTTPVSCDNALDNPEGKETCYNNRCSPQEMLSCDKYSDQSGKIAYLKSFTRLCQESAIGCELMIDTKNYSKAGGGIWNDANGDGNCTATTGAVNDKADCVKVGGDSYIYAVYNSKYNCNSEDKGCQKLGKNYNYEGQTLHTAAYLVNDPDEYSSTLCTKDAEGCDQWKSSSSGSYSYFKDPGDQVCEHKTLTGGTKWWKKKINRCDDVTANGTIESGETQICQTDSDCGAAGTACEEESDCLGGKGACIEKSCYYKCVEDDNSYDCTDTGTEPRTFGKGGAEIDQTKSGFAGICPSSESGCGEFIDPMSKPSVNLVFNSDFQDIDGNGTNGDGWIGSGPWKQPISLQNNTLYIIRANQISSGEFKVGVSCEAKIFALGTDSSLSEAAEVQTKHNQSQLFYVADNTGCEVIRYNKVKGDEVVVKNTMISYQLKDKIDYTSCNGLINYDKGCVLFNQRIFGSSGLEELQYDADLTVASSSVSPQSGLPGNWDSNKIIKVSPDRVCDKWLTCRSSVVTKDENGKEKTSCFDIGTCNSFDESGNCNGFVSPATISMQTAIAGNSASIAKYANVSGYAKVGLDSTSSDFRMRGFYPFGQMKQVGEAAWVPNGNFETYGTNKYPTGWTPATGSWSSSLFSVITSPYAAQQEAGISGKGGIGYPVEGESFLKYSSEEFSTGPVSEQIDVEPDTEYILSYEINTLNFRSNGKHHDIRAVVTVHDPMISINSASDWNNKAFIDNSYSSPGLEWHTVVTKFKTVSKDASIKHRTIALWLGAVDMTTDPNFLCQTDGDCTGNIYIDDIRLRPALEGANDPSQTPSTFNMHQLCRLYPETDSLSCDYFNDSGVREKGWPGYCLQFDRSPGSTKNCIMWWPVDKVKGDGIEEGAGYNNRYPLYYATNMTKRYTCDTEELIPIKVGTKVEYTGASCDSPGDNKGCANEEKQNLVSFYSGASEVCPGEASGSAYGYSYSLSESGGSYTLKTTYLGCKPKFGTAAETAVDCTKVESIYSDGTTDYYCPSKATPIITYIHAACGPGEYITATTDRKKISMYVAANIVQVVTPTGQNKFWSSRAYKGSKYKVYCSNNSKTCDYDADYPPFGSVVPPTGYEDNPYEWDQLAMLDSDSDEARAGSNVSPVYVKRLFAKSYGAWTWDATSEKYLKATSPSWTPPRIYCTSATRPTFNPTTMKCTGYDGVSGSCLSCEAGSSKTCDYCSIPPKIKNLKIDKQASSQAVRSKNGLMNLTFNSFVDSQQLPMVMLSVIWGDKESTTITGVEMYDREATSSPHSLFHLYDYWDMRKKKYSCKAGDIGCDQIYCGNNNGAASNYKGDGNGESCPVNSDCCMVQPKVKVKDNWGWCSFKVDASGNYVDTPVWAKNCINDYSYQPYNGWVVVTER